MSEFARTSRGIPQTEPAPAAPAVGHEAYSFACMRCGHGWEESYEIQHRRDDKGRDYVVYFARGERVPSPLTRPRCFNCGGHVVRIMDSGRVRSARSGLENLGAGPVPAPPSATAGPSAAGGPSGPAAGPRPDAGREVGAERALGRERAAERGPERGEGRPERDRSIRDAAEPAPGSGPAPGPRSASAYEPPGRGSGRLSGLRDLFRHGRH